MIWFLITISSIIILQYKIQTRFVINIVNMIWFLVILLTLIGSVNDNNFPISNYTVFIFIIGLLFFNIGVVSVKLILNKKFIYIKKFKYQFIRLEQINLIIIIILLIYFPVYYNEFLNTTHMYDSFAIKILRMREISLTQQVYSSISGQLIIISFMNFNLSVYLFILNNKKRYLQLIASFSLFIAYNFLTGTRASIIIGIACILGIFIDNYQRRYLKYLLFFFLMAIIIGGFIAVFLQKGSTDRDKSLIENSNSIIDNYIDYVIQGPILFDQYNKGNYHGQTWDIKNGLLVILDRFYKVDIPSKHASFSRFGKLKTGNVYSAFFAVFPKYSFTGIIIYFFIFGILIEVLNTTTFGIYRLLFYYVCGSMFFSIFNEQVLTNLLFSLKYFFFIFLTNFLSKYVNMRKGLIYAVR